jgi:hypothetical protein
MLEVSNTIAANIAGRAQDDVGCGCRVRTEDERLLKFATERTC